MEAPLKELLIARICSGTIRVRLGENEVFLLRKPTRSKMYIAQELYFQVLDEAKQDGLYSDSDLLAWLLESGQWDEDRQAKLDELPKTIEDFKVSLYKTVFRSNDRMFIRKGLGEAKERFGRLHDSRHAYAHLSCSGAALVAKSRYILGCSLCSEAGKRIFNSDYWDRDSSLLERVMGEYAKNRIEEVAFRELARTEPWRSIWSGHKIEGSLFGVAAADFSDEQRVLVNWSSLYDNVFGHPQCPSDEVLEDEDMFDGWMILQRRAREEAQLKKDGEEVIANAKVRNSEEIFIVADTIEDAKKVIALNDDIGKAVQKQRFAHLKKHHQVSEGQMPDTQRRLQMEQTNLFKTSMGVK